MNFYTEIFLNYLEFFKININLDTPALCSQVSKLFISLFLGMILHKNIFFHYNFQGFSNFMKTNEQAHQKYS
jgi:hypothetical protein